MKYLVLLPIFFFALLQGAFLPLNLVLLAVLSLAVLYPMKESLLIAFGSGLFLDLVRGTPLGLSALALLVVCYLLLLYRRRFDPIHPVFLPFFVFFASLGFDLLVGDVWRWQESFFLAGLAFLVRFFLVRQLAAKRRLKL